jgi:trans-2,3-dihydro-3-hydroxyanthranilate isomerase
LAHNFFIVDVFAEKKLQGNQLAVFMDADDLTDHAMQGIALEMNFSETTFITGVDKENLVFKVRIFTKDSELPFAGHPTLGTAYILQQEIIRRKIDLLNLDLRAGMIPVAFTYMNNKPDTIWMKQLNPVFGKVHKPAPVADLLGLSVDDIDPRFPIQEVSTGVPFFIVPLRTKEAVTRTKINSDKLMSYTEDTEAKWPFVFCPYPDNPENDIKARMITLSFEDPATGSANGCLAGYLVKHRYFNSSWIDVRVEQGAEIRRPSLLYLKAKEVSPTEIAVNVGGKVSMVARGEFSNS